MWYRVVSQRLACLVVVSSAAGAALPCRAGMESAWPLPMARGVDIVIQGTNLATTVALRLDGVAAPIVGAPTATKLVTRVPEGLAFPPVGTSVEVVVCRDFTPGPATECRTGAVAGEVFLAAAPPLLGTVLLPGANDVAKAGDLVAVADPASGLYVVDVSDPSLPVWVGTLPLPGARALVLRDDVAYVAADGLVTVDLSKPAGPKVLGTLPLGHRVDAIDVQNKVAYLLWGELGFVSQGDLSLVDVSNVAKPKLLSVADPVPPAQFYGENGFAVGSGFAYVGTTGGEGPGGVHVVNVEDVTRPVGLGPAGFVAGPGLAVRGQHLFGTIWSDGIGQNCVDLGCYPFDNADALRVASLDRPDAPSQVASLGTAWDDGLTMNLVVEDGASFVESDGDLIIGDVTNPENPRFVTLLDVGPPVRAFDVDSCTVAAADESGGLSLFDLTGVGDAASPALCDDDEDGDEDEDDDVDSEDGPQDFDGGFVQPFKDLAPGPR